MDAVIKDFYISLNREVSNGKRNKTVLTVTGSSGPDWDHKKFIAIALSGPK